MAQAKAAMYGNSFISLFCKTNDSLTLLPNDTPESFKSACGVLKTELIHASIAGSNLLGLFSAMNSSGILLPCMVSESEEKKMKETGLNAVTLDDRNSAIGNNVLVNDKACMINPRFGAEEKRKIEDCFGVEVIKGRIAGYNTVGASCIVTNNGFFARNDVNDDEISFLEGFFKVKGVTGTANMGVPFVGLCVVANSNGLIAGELTSGFEMQKIAESLDLI